MKRFQKILALWLTAILALTGLALAEDTAARTAAEAAEILEESGDAAADAALPDAEEACAPEDEAEPADLEAVPEGDAGSGEADGADADAPRPEAPVITARDARQDGDGVWLFAAEAEALLFAWERADAPAYRVTITDEAGGEVFAADTDAPELAVPLDGLRAETRYAFSVRALWAAESAQASAAFMIVPARAGTTDGEAESEVGEGDDGAEEGQSDASAEADGGDEMISEVEAGQEPDGEDETASEAEAGPNDGDEMASEAETDPEDGDETTSESEAEPDGEDETTTESEFDPDDGDDTISEAETDPDGEDETTTEAEAGPDDGQSDASAEVEDKDETTTESEAGLDDENETTSESESDPDGTDSSSTSGGRKKSSKKSGSGKSQGGSRAGKTSSGSGKAADSDGAEQAEGAAGETGWAETAIVLDGGESGYSAAQSGTTLRLTPDGDGEVWSLEEGALDALYAQGVSTLELVLSGRVYTLALSAPEAETDAPEVDAADGASEASPSPALTVDAEGVTIAGRTLRVALSQRREGKADKPAGE